jgi:hypothetical protein
LLGFNRRHRPDSLPHSPVLKQPSSALAPRGGNGRNERDSLRRLATGEHHAAARRAGKTSCSSVAPAPPVLGRQPTPLCVLRFAARRPESFAADGAGSKHADHWLPTTYTWSKRSSGLDSLLVSPTTIRPGALRGMAARPSMR